jgi:hypothetical protein
MSDQEGLDTRPWKHETAQGPSGHDVRDRRLPEDDRDLAEELTATESRTLCAVHHDGRLAIEDDVEARSGQALAQDLVAIGEDSLFEEVDDAFELWPAEVGEEREARDRVNKLCPVDHRVMVTEPGQRREAAGAMLTPRGRTRSMAGDLLEDT